MKAQVVLAFPVNPCLPYVSLHEPWATGLRLPAFRGEHMARAGTVCNRPGCGEDAVAKGRCPAHQPVAYGHSKERRKRSGKSGWQIQREHHAILNRDRRICYVCGQPGADEVDHIVPLFEGGSDGLENKGAIHSQPCHAVKSAAEAARAREAARLK